MINVVDEFKATAALLRKDVDPLEVATAMENVARIIENREQPIKLPENVDIVWSSNDAA